IAIGAGYEVFTTASSKNFDFVKRLGASQAFDHRTPTIFQDMVAALKDKTLARRLFKLRRGRCLHGYPREIQGKKIHCSGEFSATE
ncbi:MAG: hypothetical protein M1835_004011, partial [Candelina submexicana]